MSSPAQTNKFSGYFIDMQGDTARGSFPRYKQWNHNPNRITFIPLQGGTKVILTPSKCRLAHIDGYDTYISFQGKRMTNPVIFYRDKPGDQLDRYDTITTFLREFAGNDTYRFYIFKDEHRFNLYYSTTAGVITELLQKIYVADNNVIRSMTYKGQLQALFPDRTEEINQLLYSEESLTAFIGMSKESTTSIKKAKDETGGFYISGGVTSSSLKFTPKLSMAFSEKEYKSSQAPLVSIGYIFPFSRNFSRAYFLPQLKISSFKHTTQTLNNEAYPVYSTTFKSSPVITLGFNVGYNIINHPDLKVSLAPGGGFNLLMNFRQIDQYKSGSDNSWSVVTEMDHLKFLLDMQATVIIKKKFVIWSAYNFPTHITIYPDTKDKFTSKQVGVGYKF